MGGSQRTQMNETGRSVSRLLSIWSVALFVAPIALVIAFFDPIYKLLLRGFHALSATCRGDQFIYVILRPQSDERLRAAVLMALLVNAILLGLLLAVVSGWWLPCRLSRRIRQLVCEPAAQSGERSGRGTRGVFRALLVAVLVINLAVPFVFRYYGGYYVGLAATHLIVASGTANSCTRHEWDEVSAVNRRSGPDGPNYVVRLDSGEEIGLGPRGNEARFVARKAGVRVE